MSSSSILTLPPTCPGSFVQRAVGVAGRGFKAVARALAHRRQVGSMLELDDRMLKDIGLVRADVVGALAGPMTTDPSTLLCLRSLDNRSRQRAYEAYARRVRAG